MQIFYPTYPRLTSCCWRATVFCVQVLSSIYPFCAEAVARSSNEDERLRAEVGAEASASYPIPPANKTGTSHVTNTALCFKVNHPDAMTVSPQWVNAHDFTSPGTTSSALQGLSYLKAVKAKAAALSLSGGNFIVPSSSPNKPVHGGSVFVIDFRVTLFQSPRLADRALPAMR